MPALPEFLGPPRGTAMHALGVAYQRGGRVLSERELTRRLAAIPEYQGIPISELRAAARQARADWEATQRLGRLSRTSPLNRAISIFGAATEVIGVRVQLDLEFPGRPGFPGRRSTVPVLVNVTGEATAETVVRSALTAWNEHEVQVPHGHESGGVAISGRVVQLFRGGFPQAQVGVAGLVEREGA